MIVFFSFRKEATVFTQTQWTGRRCVGTHLIATPLTPNQSILPEITRQQLRTPHHRLHRLQACLYSLCRNHGRFYPEVLSGWQCLPLLESAHAHTRSYNGSVYVTNSRRAQRGNYRKHCQCQRITLNKWGCLLSAALVYLTPQHGYLKSHVSGAHSIHVKLFCWFSVLKLINVMSLSRQAERVGSTHSTRSCKCVCCAIDRLSNWVMSSWSRRANYFWCSTSVFVESASCEDTSKCLLRHFEVGLEPPKGWSQLLHFFVIFPFIVFHLPLPPPRAGAGRPTMWPAVGPGRMSGI